MRFNTLLSRNARLIAILTDLDMLSVLPEKTVSKATGTDVSILYISAISYTNDCILPV